MRTWTRIALVSLGAVAAAGLLTVALLVLPNWAVMGQSGLTDNDQLAAKHDIRTEVIQVLGGSGALLGLLFVARQYQLAKETQVTETYRGAVELAGSFDIEHVLGGIFVLERLGRVSTSSRWDVERFFTEYLRHYYPWPIIQRERQIGGRRVGDDPPRDQVAVVHALVHRVPSDNPLDLPGVNFTNCDLRGADLRRADLRGSHFGGADLTTAQLEGANLDGAFDDDRTTWPTLFDREKSRVMRKELKRT